MKKLVIPSTVFVAFSASMLALIPAQYQAPAWLTIALVALLVKRVMGDPKPSDGPARRAIFAVLEVLDWLLVNSEPIRAKIERTSQRPPPADTTEEP